MVMSKQIGLDRITLEILNAPRQAATILGDWLKSNGVYLTRPNGYPQYNPILAARVNLEARAIKVHPSAPCDVFRRLFRDSGTAWA